MAVTAPEHHPGPPPSPQTPAPPRPLSALDRLRVVMPGDRLASWLLIGGLGVVAFVLRLVRLSYPDDLVFDEAYYPPEAGEMLQFGYEYNRGYTFIVHPPLGKWCIALGEYLFGYNSLGWRLPSALAGTIAVILLARIVRRMTRSTFLGLVAGALLTFDGLSFVLSRTGLLDIFLQPFILGGFACLLIDRDRYRARLAEFVSTMDSPLGTVGPAAGPRGWRLSAGVLLGLACSVKWSGAYFLAGFAILSLLWDRAARKSAGVSRPTRGTALRDLPGAAWALGVVPVLAYLVTWIGWFLGETSQGRHWAEANPQTSWPFIPDALRSLWHMHGEMLTFHSGLSSSHPWESKPWSWLVDGRPILMWNPQGLVDDTGGQIVRYVLMVGTPALWFAFAPAMLWMVWRTVAHRDWRAAAVLVGISAGWLSWFINLERTMFIFYMAPVAPFFVMAVALTLGDVLGRARDSEVRRQLGLAAISLFVALVVLNFVYFYPILSGLPLSHEDWLARMWFSSWF
ncbi:MAG: phospholipid carrier-dependent glycosyltransferase [Actinomycetota bacterium]|nr:phospholipid carrier-dependent glycosyltransferase [Actinomycetota bacterium]